jgi:hypothetical protein
MDVSGYCRTLPGGEKAAGSSLEMNADANWPSPGVFLILAMFRGCSAPRLATLNVAIAAFVEHLAHR